jgi:putative oxidoreductase
MNTFLAADLLITVLCSYSFIFVSFDRSRGAARMTTTARWMTTGGRALIASLFILAAINKIMTFGPTAARMTDAGLVPAFLLLPATIALEGIGGLLVLRGGRFAAPAALLLAIFTLATNVVFHRFWLLDGAIRTLEVSLFFKNVAIVGALVYVAGTISDSRANRQR